MRVRTWLLAGLFFLIPTNLFWQLAPDLGYVTGLRIDYLIPKLYASQLLLLLSAGWLVGSWLLTTTKMVPQIHFSWKTAALLALVLALLITSLNSDYRVSSLWQWWSLAIVVGVAVLLQRMPSVFDQRAALLGMIGAIWLQVGVALYQFITQKSLFGYWFLGEPQLSLSLGLAKATWWGRELTVPYGTTAHPNILAGALSGFSLLLLATLLQRDAEKRVPAWLKTATGFTILLAILGIALTQSLSAGAALAAGIIGLALIRHQTTTHSKNTATLLLGLSFFLLIAVPVTLHFAAKRWPDQTSLSRRAVLNQAALTMWRQHPLTGVGLALFPAKLETVVQWPELVRFIQPAHHLGLLWLAETGLVGVLITAAASWSFWQQREWAGRLGWWILWATPIASLDHYFLSTLPGFMLVVMGAWFAWNYGSQVAKTDHK